MVDIPSNLLRAIDNLSECRNFDLGATQGVVSNIVSAQGKPLEGFVKASFCGIPDTGMPTDRASAFGAEENTSDDVFCYEGAMNHPPDAMLRDGGDAIEVKKIASRMNSIALNSSLPKRTLSADDPKITNDARTCEQWDSRDMLYAIGWVERNTVRYIFFVYGDCMFKLNEYYENKFEDLKNSINHDELDQNGNEYGLLRDADGLGIGFNMRIRPINHHDNPLKIFSSIVELDNNANFSLVAIMRSSKFESFPDHAQHLLTDNPGIRQERKQIKNPDNPEEEIDVEVFSFSV